MGKDGISQTNLILGAEVLSIPLTRIINKSIESGIVPKIWIEALVTPVLKKGIVPRKYSFHSRENKRSFHFISFHFISLRLPII